MDWIDELEESDEPITVYEGDRVIGFMRPLSAPGVISTEEEQGENDR